MRLLRTLLPLLLLSTVLVGPLAAQTAGPTTEFEDNGGADWTSGEGEQAFLAAVADSPRASVVEVARTLEDRPIQLVTLGDPAPASTAQITEQPSILFTCSVHGNEPAGREACLIQLRDLAFSDDPALTELLATSTIMFIPTVNPDGREANSRGNSLGVDINRDHMNLRQVESQAVAAVIRDTEPDAVVDLHEYSSTPLVYDDDVTVLWPRNVNTDDAVYDLAVELAQDWLIAGVEEDGFTGDEYGLSEIGGQDITQTAGGPDEGILRNVGGLRHSLGILVESNANARLVNPVDPADAANTMPRRVASQVSTIDQAIEFVAERGTAAMQVTADARELKTAEGLERSAPMYFGGQRQDSTIDGSGPPPSEAQTIDPPVCGYLLTPAQHQHVALTLDLLGIGIVETADGIEVPMGQQAEPIIHLLLDPRGDRNHFTGTDATWDGEGTPTALDEGCAQLAAGPLPADDLLVRRIAGQDRPATAAAVAEIAVVEADAVVIATTTDYADALGGTTLATSMGAPLLLSDPDALSQPVEDEIIRRGATEAVLLGGPAALGEQVAADLEALGVTVERIGGATRFETAVLVRDRLVTSAQFPQAVTVAEGESADPARGWPDAVSAAAFGQQGLLLTNGTYLPDVTRDALADTAVTIIGGTDAVSAQVEAEIAAVADSVTRIAGATRYATSAAVADASDAFAGDPDAPDAALPPVWLASGADWPEALVAAAAGRPFLLVDGRDLDGSPETVGLLEQHRARLRTVNVVATTEQVAEDVLDRLRTRLAGE